MKYYTVLNPLAFSLRNLRIYSSTSLEIESAIDIWWYRGPGGGGGGG